VCYAHIRQLLLAATFHPPSGPLEVGQPGKASELRRRVVQTGIVHSLSLSEHCQQACKTNEDNTLAHAIAISMK
jgi:hypothetical protein